MLFTASFHTGSARSRLILAVLAFLLLFPSLPAQAEPEPDPIPDPEVPVVVSEVGGFAETVSDGVDGLLAAPGSAVALAEAVCRVLGSPHMSARLVAGGRRTAAAHSWDEVAAGTMDVYHEAHVDRDLGRWRRGLCPAGNGTKLTRQEGIVR